FGSASAGPGTVTATVALTGSTKTNYQLSTTSAQALATIDKRSVTASIAASGKTYDGTTAATVTSCGLETQTLDHGVVSPDDVGCSTSNANFGSASAGPGTVTATVALTGSTKTNYQLSTTSAQALATITVRPITVTADAKTKVYGYGDPALTYQVTSGSLVTGDSFTGALTRAAGANIGSYAIQQGTLALSSNYNLTYVGANLAITVRPITVTADAKPKVYGYRAVAVV